jgi:hypothetical protein
MDDKIINAVIEPLDDYTVNVSGRCPHCLKHISFAHFESVFTLTPQICPVCGKTVAVTPIEHCDHDALSETAKALLSGKNAAVWAINQNNFYWLLKSMPVLQADSVTFINNYEVMSPENGRAIKTLAGKKIFMPDVIEDKNIKAIIVPNTPHVFRSITAQCEKRFPCIEKIVHITELMRKTR